ncbi:neprilysin-3-like [Ornithodoros turicata]|uniref:neprilysin-3-like n=1 Tax=Ornithodoros turicata TaxID=34597 RepID=UPI003138C601
MEAETATEVVDPKSGRCYQCFRVSIVLAGVVFLVASALASGVMLSSHLTSATTVSTTPVTIAPRANLCSSRSCHKLATILSRSYDEHRDPCLSFDDFVCSKSAGSFMKDYEENQYRMAADALSEIRSGEHTPVEKIARFFQECIVSKAPDRQLFHKFLLDNHLGLAPKQNPVGIMLQLAVKYGYGILFDLTARPCSNGTVLLSFEPQQDLTAWAQGAKQVKSRMSRLQYIVRHLSFLQNNHHGDREDHILTTETIVHRLLFSAVHVAQSPNKYLSLDELDATSKFVKSEMLLEFLRADSRFPADTTYHVSSKSAPVLYFVNDVLNRVKQEHLGPYLTWEASRHLGPLVSELFRVPVVYRKHYTSMATREVIGCFTLVHDLAGTLAFAPLVSRYMNGTASAMLEEMFKIIRRSYVKNVRNATWIANGTKASLLTKLEHARLSLGSLEYDPLLINKNSVYNELPLLRGSFFENYLALSAWRMKNGWATEDTTNRVHHTGAEDNATVSLPSVWTLPPLFYTDGSLAANYALIGSLVASQFIKILDIEHSEHGQLSNQTECLKNFYHEPSGSVILKIPRTVNDIMKIKPLYEAFIEASSINNASTTSLPVVPTYSTPQTFFQVMCLRFCPYQTWVHKAPHSLSCNVPMMNVKEFADAYRCPQHSPMNPEKRCPIWTS